MPAQVAPASPDRCRHTYVTMLQASGVPMETIAALTGHADIKTTEGYLQHVCGRHRKSGSRGGRLVPCGYQKVPAL
ncbi:MAG: tyrosine-type recombinase/integrase [Dysosmobacter sp.]